MKKFTLLFSFLLFISSANFAQENEGKTKASFSKQADSYTVVPSIASQIENGTFIPAENIIKEVNPKKRDGNKVVPGKGLPLGGDPLLNKSGDLTKNPSRSPLITWIAASSGTTPTDPTGAIGPNHYVNSWNSAFRIWDTEGNSLAPAASLGTIWPGETSGDPIVMYDKFADRWIITQFTFSNGFLVAISQGPDPVNDDWHTYEFLIDAFPDYPKYSVWSDGYYITANKNSGSAGTSDVVFVIERDKIIAGDATAQIVGFPLAGISTSGFYSPLGFNCNGTELPPAGGAPIVYMQDDAWAGISSDHLKIWTIDVDWDNTDNSTISAAQEITTEVFDGVFDGGSFVNLPQPAGSDIDALQATIMYMAQYRRFPSYNSVVLNFAVDLDGNDDHAGIRWYELHQTNDGNDWEIYQEGTYEQPGGHSAFMGSIAQDALGNIGLAYSVVSDSQTVSIRYTGRYFSDPLNEMTVTEDTIQAAVQNNPSTRYGDYGQMTIDPTDDKTFWMISEYFAGGTRKNIVGAFKLAADLATDAGIVDISSPSNGTLTSTETITVLIRNFGIDTLFGVPVSYSVDGGTAVSETYSDTILPSSSVPHTFTTTEDLSIAGNTYEITAYTGLVGDMENLNDTLSIMVTHLQPNDIGVTSIADPNSGSGLSASETIKVSIENFGGATQSDFEVSYTLNGGTPVTEIVAGPLDGPSSMEYTFTTTADLSVLGSYTFEAYTSLTGDSDETNDSSTKLVENSMCQPSANCNVGDGFQLFELTTINNPSDCSPDGYGDYTDLIADLEQGSTNDLTLTTGYGSQYVTVWIDFNDNFNYESSEKVVNNYILNPGGGSGSYTETIDFVIPADAILGEHLMRAKSNWNANVPSDACDGTTYGETEDYIANITLIDGIYETSNESNPLTISYMPNNHFVANFTTVNLTEALIITVHNSLGQKVIQNRVQNVNGVYTYDFDMSYAAPGVYLVRLGSEKFGKIEKIVVK